MSVYSITYAILANEISETSSSSFSILRAKPLRIASTGNISAPNGK